MMAATAPGAGRRPRLLLGWELGGGLGHATRLFVLAERLLGRDFDILLALRPGSSGEEVFAPLLGNPGRCRLIPAPVVDPGALPHQGGLPSSTLAYPLIRFGYGEPARVFAAADRWNGIIDRLSPSLVISDARHL